VIDRTGVDADGGVGGDAWAGLIDGADVPAGDEEIDAAVGGDEVDVGGGVEVGGVLESAGGDELAVGADGDAETGIPPAAADRRRPVV